MLFVLPTSVVLMYSVCRRDFHGGALLELSWQAWSMATDAITLRILARTVLLAGGVTLFNLLLAYPCSATLVRMSPRRRAQFLLAISFPLVTSLLLRTYGWL